MRSPMPCRIWNRSANLSGCDRVGSTGSSTGRSTTTPTGQRNALSPTSTYIQAMATHRAVHVKSAGAPLELVDVENKPPDRDEVRLTVSACGICGTDAHFVNGGFPGMSWPLTPGHEIAGKIAELGDGVEGFSVGDRVAVGWFGGGCYPRAPGRQGIFIY